MGGRIAFHMPVNAGLRYDSVKLSCDVLNYAGVGMLINRNSCRGMRNENLAQATFDTAGFHQSSNVPGDVQEVNPCPRIYF